MSDTKYIVGFFFSLKHGHQLCGWGWEWGTISGVPPMQTQPSDIKDRE